MTCFVDAALHAIEQGMSISRVVELAIIKQMVLLIWLQAVYVSTVGDRARHVEGQELGCHLLIW